MTPSEPRGPIVVDTTVFGLELVPTRADLALQYEPLLLGRLTHISFMTVAELRYGARLANWGTSRRQKLETRLAGAEVDWPGPDLVETYVGLRARCTMIGHGLAQKEHETAGLPPPPSGSAYRSWPTTASSRRFPGCSS